MRKIILTVLLCSLLVPAAAGARDAMNAMNFYQRGLESSLAYKRIDYFTRALVLDPNLADAYEKRALIYYIRESFDKAARDYTRVIELKPGRAEAYKMRGIVYLKQGRLEEAIADLGRAVEISPKMANAYGSRAEAFRLKGMAAKAISDATRAIRLHAGERITAEAYATRAKAYRELGQDEQAEADFQRYVELHPRFFLLRYLSGTASLDTVGRIGLIGVICLVFVGIFKLALPKPRKKDKN